MLWTNSTKISIKNNSGTNVTVYLFSTENDSTPILEMTLSNKEEKAFTNLSSQYGYFVRISSDSSTHVSVTVSGKIKNSAGVWLTAGFLRCLYVK